MAKNPEQLWIVKPVAAAQGKGIFITKEEAKIPKKSSNVCSLYIMNPLLINEIKFDLRLYVGITSFNPLRVYLYEEGIVWFASSKYSNDNVDSKFAHLTNYSINKLNEDSEQDSIKWLLT